MTRDTAMIDSNTTAYPVMTKEDGSAAPTTAALLFEIREQQRIGTGYKFRYSQTDDTLEKATFVRKWKEVQESKYYLKAACQVVWMREEQERREKRREEERLRRLEEEAIRRREQEEREQQREEQRRIEAMRMKKMFAEQELAPWWVRAAMVQIPPVQEPQVEQVACAMEGIYDDYTDTYSDEIYTDSTMTYDSFDQGFDSFDNSYNPNTYSTGYSLRYNLNPSFPPTNHQQHQQQNHQQHTPTPTTTYTSHDGWCKSGAELCFV